MRPGRFHPGNVLYKEKFDELRAGASMRPGRFHPGNFMVTRTLSPVKACVLELQ